MILIVRKGGIREIEGKCYLLGGNGKNMWRDGEGGDVQDESGIIVIL